MKTILIITLITAFYYNAAAQDNNPKGIECNLGYSSLVNWDPDYLGGQWKPESIERYTTDPNAVFPVLVVFVQYKNDPGPDVSHWHSNQAPGYINDVIHLTKKTSVNWWEAYDENTETLSDYWMEVSRGKFHVTGQAVSVVLPYTADEYRLMYGAGGFSHAIDDMFNYLASLQGSQINWLNYDKWSKDSQGNWVYVPDGYADMLYISWRSQPDGIGMTHGQTPHPSCYHGDDHTVFNSGGQQVIVKNGGWPSEQHSTFMISPGHGGSGTSYFMYSPLNKWATISFSGHEHGHYLYAVRNFGWLGGHQLYSKVNNYNGMEEFLSPYELIRLGYFTTQKVNFISTPNYGINDWSSRDNFSYSQILEVPIGDANRNEFFLISNRQKESYYDKIMWGDTAHGDPYRGINPEYGKGIYIYHAYPGYVGQGYQWQVPIDQECADGLFNWVQDGFKTPDWSNTQQIEYFKKTDVSYSLNDLGGAPFTGASGRDGKSLTVWSPLYGTDMVNWFGLGKKEFPSGTGGDGTDRYWTNLIENVPYSYQYPYQVWTSREWQGDRWDAWKVGYNEVFSPYSSPSTANWDNQSTGIFIYLESMNGQNANFKVYKTGESGLTEWQILELTPPSKPMNLKSDFCYQSASFPYYYYNKLTWNHNLEPDMRRNVRGSFVKRYRIYKVSSPNMTLLPDENNYSLIATVDIDENQPPSYVDMSEPSGCNEVPDVSCPPVCWNLHAVRYRVVAVDVFETPSVKSDFTSSSAYTITNGGGTETGDSPRFGNNQMPTSFSLLQNYPNPFNPSTEIKFELPQNTFVTLKVYNAVGQVVAELINNEYKNAGRYSVNFDGTKLASGIYFYSIEAGTFKDVKKMVLIK